MGNYIAKVDQLLNMPMETSPGTGMGNYIGKTAQLLNISVGVRSGIYMGYANMANDTLFDILKSTIGIDECGGTSMEKDIG
jgi:hypothetical protein